MNARLIWLCLWLLMAGAAVMMCMRSYRNVDILHLTGTFQIGSEGGTLMLSRYDLTGIVRNSRLETIAIPAGHRYHPPILKFSRRDFGAGDVGYDLEISWLLIAAIFALAGLFPFVRRGLARYLKRRRAR